MLKEFDYRYDAGPFSTIEELMSGWETGNCRRALQYYFYFVHKIFLSPEQVLCPNAYYKTGKFLFSKNQVIDYAIVKTGSIIYAERIRNKDEEFIYRNENNFINFDDYLVSLHTAIYTGEKGKEIWHATSIEGRSCYWPLEKFKFFYKPIVVKILINLS